MTNNNRPLHPEQMYDALLQIDLKDYKGEQLQHLLAIHGVVNLTNTTIAKSIVRTYLFEYEIITWQEALEHFGVNLEQYSDIIE